LLVSIGALALFGVVQITTGQADMYIGNVINMMIDNKLQERNVHDTSKLLLTYGNQITKVTIKLLVLLISYALIVLAWSKFRPGNFKKRLSNFFVANLILVPVIFPISQEQRWQSIGDFTLALMMFNLFWMLILINKFNDGKKFLLVGILNFSPLLIAVGTNNPIGGQTVTGNGGVFLTTLLLMSISVSFSQNNKHLPLLWITAMIIIMTPSVFEANTNSLYRVSPVSELTERIESLEPIKRIYVSDGESESMKWLQMEIRRLEGLYEFVPLTNAGFNFTFQNSGFSSPWVDKIWPITFDNLKKSCDERPVYENVRVALIAPNLNVVRDLSDLLNSSLQGCGFSFPSDFKIESSDPLGRITIFTSHS
jgi:hypothetical protein